VQFGVLITLLKRIDKLKFFPLGILKEITVMGRFCLLVLKYRKYMVVWCSTWGSIHRDRWFLWFQYF